MTTGPDKKELKAIEVVTKHIENVISDQRAIEEAIIKALKMSKESSGNLRELYNQLRIESQRHETALNDVITICKFKLDQIRHYINDTLIDQKPRITICETIISLIESRIKIIKKILKLEIFKLYIASKVAFIYGDELHKWEEVLNDIEKLKTVTSGKRESESFRFQIEQKIITIENQASNFNKALREEGMEIKIAEEQLNDSGQKLFLAYQGIHKNPLH